MVALAAPLRVTVAPLPLAAGLIVPEMLQVGADELDEMVKLTPATFAPLTVAAWLPGLKLKPVLPGVTT